MVFTMVLTRMNELALNLLKKQQDRGRTGFTLPFLVGAMRSPIGQTYNSENKDYNEFISVLEYFQCLSTPQCIGISECTVSMSIQN